MGREERRARQRAEAASMSLRKRIVIVVSGILAVVATWAGLDVLLGDEIRWGTAIMLGLFLGCILSYQYLWLPSRDG